MKDKLEIYGPVQLDCVLDWWQVVQGGRVLATFLRKSDAKNFIRHKTDVKVGVKS